MKILHGTKGELPLDVVVCENKTLEDVLFSMFHRDSLHTSQTIPLFKN